jgi:hypothetical protein
MLVALWDEAETKVSLRLLFLLVGGLSSPFVFVVFETSCCQRLDAVSPKNTRKSSEILRRLVAEIPRGLEPVGIVVFR